MLTDSQLSSSPSVFSEHGSPTPGSAGSGQSEGCPTPLDWRQVVTAYRQKSKPVTVETDSGSIDAVCFGTGPPLYLLNGFVGNHDLFALLAWLLHEEHTAVVVDWHVDTLDQRSSAEQHLVTLAAQLINVADELGHLEWAMHATSFGCLVAMQAMLDFPTRISRCSLQGAFAGRQFSLTERALMFLGRHSDKTLADLAPAIRMQQENHRKWYPPFDASRWSFYEELMGRTPVRELSSRATLAGRVDLEERLPQMNTPLLVIACEGDGPRGVEAQLDISDATPHSSVESLDNCGSTPHVTHPHRLAKLLRQFRDNGLSSNSTPTTD